MGLWGLFSCKTTNVVVKGFGGLSNEYSYNYSVLVCVCVLRCFVPHLKSQTLQISSGEGGIARGCAHGCIVPIM